MHCVLTIFSCLLLLISYSRIVVEAIDIYSIEKDLAEFNITCYEEKCEEYNIDSLAFQVCHCGMQCYQLGTCCLNSIFVDVPQPELKPTCRLIFNKAYYFVVDQCPSDSVWADSCNNDWNGDDDVQKLVPVTSLLTSITYKNYYCFRCHETNDDFLYWILKIESEFTQYETSESVSEQLDKQLSLTYNKDWETWMAIYDEKIGYFPVYLSIEIPSKIKRLVHVCEPDVISDCSPEWSDEEMKSKCQSYMTLKEVRRNGGSLKYRNIHCALCNFENIKDVHCRTVQAGGFGGKTPFSFTYLLDINRSDGEYVGKKQKCPDDHVWDRYANVCRKLTCALPGHSIKNGKCVQM